MPIGPVRVMTTRMQSRSITAHNAVRGNIGREQAGCMISADKEIVRQGPSGNGCSRLRLFPSPAQRTSAAPAPPLECYPSLRTTHAQRRPTKDESLPVRELVNCASRGNSYLGHIGIYL